TVSAMPWYGFIQRSHGDGTSKDWYGVSSHSGEPALRQSVVWNSRMLSQDSTVKEILRVIYSHI
ncbi:hypothetical protein KL942_005434, partial [Ogataea angusta]